VAGPLSCHAAPGDATQLALDERNELPERTLIALAPRQQKPGDLTRNRWDAPILRAFSGAGCQVLASVPASVSEEGQRVAIMTTKMAASVIVMTITMAATASAHDERETIVLSVENRCHIRQAAVVAAQQTATAIYDRIGVQLLWLDRHLATLPVPAGALQLRVVLVGEIAEERLLSALSLPRAERTAVLGMAPTATRSVYLFCRRIESLAKVSRITALAIALGRAFAHEIGHLVLPHIPHSDTGIMRPRLDLYNVEAPGFTADQAESIRTLLMRSN
jgi:hypothetical protein